MNEQAERHGPLHAVEEAFEGFEETDERLRSSGLWVGWMWLVIAIATTGLLLIVETNGDSNLALAVVLAFGALSLGLAVYAERPALIDRVAAELERPVTWAYLVAVLIAIVVIVAGVLPDGFSLWLLLVSVLPAIPCLVGAYRVLVIHR